MVRINQNNSFDIPDKVKIAEPWSMWLQSKKEASTNRKAAKNWLRWAREHAS